ncbi:CYTH domain-containing protein [Paraburkholderia caballeronis]|uniref:CYTH domain-containing protein n=1 Tax=Paraburkholderia caballeronis TaxID=416943 RepID=A0A1H7VCS8_9BURK|nr:CYTH domain-containing protein [Paraburkholderia caballeronis]PXW16890.1 CYTH domain-containing protein [Paraburkholderia caballeronis]PXW94662.1 CYTH domain-containing protein [Paraburkholderia caballeronis]RAJ89947.1 CYTH domain-containing protein [Paraburkholderia caballeronis]SEB60134.1 CYTH domain-containing protein [Paraburkholderia caballeronis]SEM06854.1 CYTH domain-containing protein [Paraburkholderia caballeronis]
MGIEREIKLALPRGQVDAALRFFAARAGAPGRDVRLENVYFDTPRLTLSAAKSALRLRRTPDGWLQTFKTVGVSQNGLHERHEWEMPVAGAALEADRVIAECEQSGEAAVAAALRDAAPSLIALFRTDFTRTLWTLDTGNAQVEAAVDQGEVVADVNGETRRTPICEIELELKDGDEAALHTLAAELTAALPGLAPDDVSKAQRGYRLREG